jgi:hypothetical protein
MENERAIGVAGAPASQQSTGIAPPISAGGVVPSMTSNLPPPTAQKAPLKMRSRRRWLWVALVIGVVLLVGGGIVVMLTSRPGSQQVQTGEFNNVQIPLGSLASAGDVTSGAQSLKVNGQLQLSGSMVVAPGLQPQRPTRGQIYFDQTSNQLAYYNGQQFVGVGGSSLVTNNTTSNTTNVTNIFNTGEGVGVQLQAASPGVQQAGNFNISGIGQVGTLRTGTVSNSSNISVITDNGAGTTGNITIKSGDSSTTASGNINIDAGVGIIDGEIVENKTFESGVDQMQVWFNTSIATTTDQAHSGTQSLETTLNNSFWGIIEILPGTPVTPGHQYHFSIWVRAATTGRQISARAVWHGTGGLTTAFTPTSDNATGWTEMTLTAAAPAASTSVSFEIQSNAGAVGEVHYFDDITITDLSSGSAISSLDLGSTNAKVITIGNLNQIGATTIRGGSGVDIQSGAAGTTINGGTVNITGDAASTLSTTAGALTITSAKAATWGVGTSSTAAGENLTLKAGNGAGGNNNGGDLVLQGGASTGTGIGGSVIVRPLNNSTDAFQIQNSSSVALFAADSTNMQIIVSGTTGTFANLVLDNAHFKSTQTTAPTIGTPVSCGTGPAAAVNAGSTDTAGSFTITTGTGGTSSSCDTVLTFNKTYGAAPKSIIVVGNSDSQSVTRQIFVSSSSATTFTTRFAVSAGGADNTMYSFNYWVVE